MCIAEYCSRSHYPKAVSGPQAKRCSTSESCRRIIWENGPVKWQIHAPEAKKLTSFGGCRSRASSAERTSFPLCVETSAHRAKRPFLLIVMRVSDIAFQ